MTTFKVGDWVKHREATDLFLIVKLNPSWVTIVSDTFGAGSYNVAYLNITKVDPFQT